MALEQTGGYYNFSNIRYAAPPVGELRFRAPTPPAVNRSSVQDGLETRMCPQSYPPWMATIGWVPDYLQSGTIPNNTVTASVPSNNSSSAAPRDPSQSEDCLFLDVMVPQSVFESAGRGDGAPVLVWIYGTLPRLLDSNDCLTDLLLQVAAMLSVRRRAGTIHGASLAGVKQTHLKGSYSWR